MRKFPPVGSLTWSAVPAAILGGIRRIGIKAVLFALVCLAGMPLEARAQAVQTIDFPISTINGNWGTAGCGGQSGSEYGTNTSGASLTVTWTDTTGVGSPQIQIEVQTAWKFFVPGGAYTVSINGGGLGNGIAPSNSSQCNTAPFETTTQVFGPGGLTYYANAPNSITFTHSGSNWIGVMDNTSGWAVRVLITVLNQPPDVPNQLIQIGPDGKTVPVDGKCQSSTLRIRARVTDPDNNDCTLEVEIRPTSVFFLGTPNFTSGPVASGSDAIVEATGLADGAYHWQVRTVDPFGVVSPWSSFGSNSEVAADVRVDTTPPPPKAIDTANHAGGDCILGVRGPGGSMTAALVGLALLGWGWSRRR
jgi:hypothetical protein